MYQLLANAHIAIRQVTETGPDENGWGADYRPNGWGADHRPEN